MIQVTFCLILTMPPIPIVLTTFKQYFTHSRPSTKTCFIHLCFLRIFAFGSCFFFCWCCLWYDRLARPVYYIHRFEKVTELQTSTPSKFLFLVKQNCPCLEVRKPP